MLHPSKQAHNFGYYYLGHDEDFADSHGICCMKASWWAFIIKLNAGERHVESNTIDHLFCENCRKMICLEADKPQWG